MTRGRWTLAAVLAVLAGARLALPSFLHHRLNATLAGLKGYTGSVRRVHLGLLRGKLELDGVKLTDRQGQTRLAIPAIALNVNYGAFVRERVVEASIDVRRPRGELVVRKRESPRRLEEKREARRRGKRAAQEAPRKAGGRTFRLDAFTLEDGEVVVRDAESGHETRITAIEGSLKGFTNRAPKGRPAVARGRLSAKLDGGGTVGLGLDMDPTAGAPKFELALDVRHADLRALNPLLRWQWGVDVDRGSFDLFAQAKAQGGRFKGYLKPMIEDLKLIKPGEKLSVAKVKKAVVGVVAAVLKNRKSDAVATIVPFEGEFDREEGSVEDERVAVWTAVVQVLRNAFIEALTPRFEKLL